MDVTNGKDIGVSLFVQGCHFHCKGCFNEQTWDFSDGKEWTPDVEDKFMCLIENPHVKRVSVLGGEPLAYENLPNVYDIVKRIRDKFPDKKIWLWTGNELSMDDFDSPVDGVLIKNHILRFCDYVVDGRFVEEKRDLSLMFRGSSNQRIIDVRESLRTGKVVECDFNR